MFVEARSRILSMSAWLECYYGIQPILHFSDDIIHSCCGVQQGDPLGPLGFFLALQPILEQINLDVSGLLINVWYLDDWTVCGPVSDHCTAHGILEVQGPSRGLLLNRKKFLLIIPPDASPPPLRLFSRVLLSTVKTLRKNYIRPQRGFRVGSAALSSMLFPSGIPSS